MTCSACLTIPPVVKTDYTPKGTYENIAGLKTYSTGSSNSTKTLLAVYDIFGFAPQTLQGADILATALNIRVLIPDLLNGRYAQGEWYAPSAGEAEKKAQGEFMGFVMGWDAFVPKMKEVMEAAGTGEGKVWAGYGLCWGGKLIAQTSTTSTHFKASAQIHPGFLASTDAEAVTIPHMVLASKDEDPVVVGEYKSIVEKRGGKVETFAVMPHGRVTLSFFESEMEVLIRYRWMGARANFDDEEGLKEYERGYTALAEFLKGYL
ncbi:alpha/beta-Hydrolase [Glarea lozoyensis ATCC 20868]|uniref:Alpha/beta-Hydrolase n=2 Tax=Glarea lozoyensis TaxID=101852 RepID=S3DTC9_GLAL2|nr:alpha/beta-Hydrolase [Glarea lozoyensis ATCC 20868]EHL03589.1 putative Uncharacterized AIM2 family protein C30D10.14 [Glarea lozoyensis 74030]EPE29678.1 alpha/beta-Hydrolase [Glarea lozoyensis ATCC 20868]